jgi:uncharacterized protein YndB with AHSA1/START domain
MTETIHVDQFLPQAPAKVWRMLTEPDRLARWWAPGDIRPEVGHHFTLDMGKWGPRACTVTAVEDERLLSYTFGEGTTDWTITWRLVEEGAGTRLFLEHGGFDMDDPQHREAYENMSRGWAGAVLPGLARRLEEVTTS